MAMPAIIAPSQRAISSGHGVWLARWLYSSTKSCSVRYSSSQPYQKSYRFGGSPLRRASR
jgi:hypothetical protein